MRFVFGLFALALGIAASPAFARDCTFENFGAVPGVDLNLQWAARSGHSCVLNLKVGARADNTSIAVVQQAAHGTAGTPTPLSISYVSRPGFVGRDSFVIESTAEVMSRIVIRGTAHWTINVNVTP